MVARSEAEMLHRDFQRAILSQSLILVVRPTTTPSVFLSSISTLAMAAGITVHPNEAWIKQIARNATMDDCGALRDCRYLLHDRDAKFTRSFRAILVSGPG